MSEDVRKMIDKVKSFKQFLNEDVTNMMDVWYHGSDKNFKIPRKGVESNVDLHGFFVTKDFEYAKLHSPKTRNVYSMSLNNQNSLDLSYLDENTILKNKTIFKRKMMQDFPFQKEFEYFAFSILNNKRKSNSKEPYTLDYFLNGIVNEFRPTSNEWNFEGLGSDYLIKYIKEKNYDSVLFKREMLIINTDIINNFKKIN